MAFTLAQLTIIENLCCEGFLELTGSSGLITYNDLYSSERFKLPIEQGFPCEKRGMNQGNTRGGKTMRADKVKVPMVAFSKQYNLSPREQDVLQLMIARVVNAEDISQKLGISQNTVRIHVKNINSKVGARSKTEILSAFILFLDNYYERIMGTPTTSLAQQLPS
jgi:DNA-binding CsgD family transcriptional regulator